MSTAQGSHYSSPCLPRGLTWACKRRTSLEFPFPVCKGLQSFNELYSPAKHGASAARLSRDSRKGLKSNAGSCLETLLQQYSRIQVCQTTGSTCWACPQPCSPGLVSQQPLGEFSLPDVQLR